METTITNAQMFELMERRETLHRLVVKFAPKTEKGKQYRAEYKAVKEAIQNAITPR